MQKIGRWLLVLLFMSLAFSGKLCPALALAEEQEEGLVAYWPFDEGEGNTVKDVSGNNNDGAILHIHGAKWVEGKLGKALEFDGIKDGISCGRKKSWQITEALTIEAWVYVKKETTGRIISRNYFGGNQGYALYCTRGKFYFFVGNGTISKYLFSPLILNEWVHLAGTFDGRYVRIYVDGEEKQVQDFGEKTTIKPCAPSVPLYIGCAKSGKTLVEFFSGVIDEVRIYKRALSEEEIKAHYEKKGQGFSKIAMTP